MDKESQSILDFVMDIPDGYLSVHRSPINNREASMLFNLWKRGEERSGKIVLEEDVDRIALAALTSKGFIKSTYIFDEKLATQLRAIELLPKAKEVIRNIVLFTTKSSFSKDANDSDINYEAVHRAAERAAKSRSDKIKMASSQKNSRVRSWLEKCL